MYQTKQSGTKMNKTPKTKNNQKVHIMKDVSFIPSLDSFGCSKISAELVFCSSKDDSFCLPKLFDAQTD
jgi:hypothetical protein